MKGKGQYRENDAIEDTGMGFPGESLQSQCLAASSQPGLCSPSNETSQLWWPLNHSSFNDSPHYDPVTGTDGEAFGHPDDYEFWPC